MNLDLSKLRKLNAQRWASAKLTRKAEYRIPVQRILAARPRYEQIQARTGVHWVYIACAHYRESNLDFSKQLAQGDPLDKPSRNVPKGRGPFKSFEDSAYDALVNCQPKAASNPIWKTPNLMPDMLTLLEMYNGLGYAYKGRPSPYLWSGTDQYESGKYVRDGVYDPKVIDKQLGVAGLILCLLEVDPTIFNQKPVEAPQKPAEKISPPEATQVALKPGEALQPLPELPRPIVNKAGEDITDNLYSFLQGVWEWLKKH